jgi:Right handed beta helix region
MKRLFFMVLGLGLFFCAMTSAAQAQATRTWVSGVGDDANPCSRTAPCKTFPGAYSKTATGGEIDVIDPGGFGTITIGHSITIDGGGGVMASILGSLGPAVTINGGASDNIILRNLTLQGISDYTSPGTTAINFNSGKSLSIEHCVIENWSQYGVFMNTTTSTRMNIANSEFNHMGLVAIYSSSSGSINGVNVVNSTVVNAGTGVQAHNNASIQVSYSTVANNIGDGLFTDGTTNSSITAENSTITANNIGVHATNGTIRIGHNSITFNSTGMQSVAPGKINSWMDNRVAGNSVNGVPDAPQLTYL